MKIVKIILVVVVVAVIVFFVNKWYVNIDKPKEINPSTNPFIERIEGEIDSLNNIPVNVFCQQFYKDIQFRISDYFNQGLYGESENDNNQWQEILSKNLYYAYAPKFAEQAMYVFNGSEWKNDALDFIRSEVRTLQISSYLDDNSPVDLSFNSIGQILTKYDEISGFIVNCRGFSYSSFALDYNYPDLSVRVNKSRGYLANNLDYQYVNNCTRLRDGLQKIPKILYDKHISYLRRKISYYGIRYTDYKYQSEYSDVIYIPLRNQVDALNNNIYGINDKTFNNGFDRMYDLLKRYNRDATNYFRKILTKYNEINSFISICKSFSYSNYGLERNFPDVSDKIKKSRDYLSINIDNPLVNDNNSMKNDLQEIPKILFDKHISYLRKKINDNGRRYTEYKYKYEYLNTIYTPLKNQVDALNNDIYNVNANIFDIGYNSLETLLSEYNRDANNYFNTPKRERKSKRRNK
jgi:hypothetical protein